MGDARPFRLNIPNDIWDWLELEAKRNLRSRGSEVVLALREKMERASASSEAEGSGQLPTNTLPSAS